MNTCPTCGLPSDERYVGPPLTAIKERIYRLIVQRPGITADAIADAIYADYGDGGPDGGRKVIHVHINQINRTLCAIGSRVRIRGSKYDGYHVVRKVRGEQL